MLSAAVAVAAILIGRGASQRREAEAADVAEWVRDAVRGSQDAGAPDLGRTEAVVGDAFASWVRGRGSDSRLRDARVDVSPVGAWESTRSDGATHRARVTLGGSSADVELAWDPGRTGSHRGAITSLHRVD
ncbi:MAG: hypothetical protein EBU70_10695 [Actinobacteria bacterium]|nr:hypothetical protein [Actinomycetota bacterium]